MLAATEHIVVGTSIVNVWAYEPADLAAEYAELTRDFPDRLIVGIGVGHPEAARDYSRPLTALREFLEGLDAADPPLPRDRRCLAALAPKTLALSADRSLGTIPYFTPVAHTRAAREQLGPDVLVAPELAFALDDDVAAGARDRAELRGALPRPPQLHEQPAPPRIDRGGHRGWGLDRLLDAVVPHRSLEAITTVARGHLEAGADHLALQALGEPGIPRRGWAALAEAMAPGALRLP